MQAKAMDSWVACKRRISFNRPASRTFFSIRYGTQWLWQNSSTGDVFSRCFRNLADHDKDGRLTPDEFVVAMHCCDLLRAGQTLPTSLPDDWLPGIAPHRERADSLPKGNVNATFAGLNQQLKETVNTTENTTAQAGDEPTEAEQRAAAITYEEKRLKNYEVRRSKRCVQCIVGVLSSTRMETANWNVVDNSYANRKNGSRRSAKNEVRAMTDPSWIAIAVRIDWTKTGSTVRICFRTKARIGITEAKGRART